MDAIVLEDGREKSLLRQHPWVFSGAIARVDGQPTTGQTVEVRSARGDLLAVAAYSPSSQIRARAWSFEPVSVDRTFLARRIGEAIARRGALGLLERQAVRLVYGESDGLPGLVVDRYGPVLVMQCLTAGTEFWRETIVEVLREVAAAEALYERSDSDARSLEGLEPRCGLVWGELPPGGGVEIDENGVRFGVDVTGGHKTGFYLDQRDARRQLRELSRGKDVLDAFCYTGGFAVNALAGGAASVLAVDSSGQALEACRHNVVRNTLPEEKLSVVEGDVFRVLRSLRDAGRSFDRIVLDPPKFAPTASRVERAARGYKDINLLAFRLLRPGGILLTFSCSGGVDDLLFQKIVASAALDARVPARVVGRLHQAADHPVLLSFPEAAYLKGLVCQRDSSTR